MRALATLAAMAAALVASESDAADLDRKAPGAVDYVKVCDTYGAGFFYIPGSDTCLKIGGYVRGFAYAGGGDGDYGSGRDRDRIGTMTRFDLEIDARSQTEFGLLRSIAEIRFNLSSGGGSVETEIEQGYLQWGGLTAGRAQSFFDFFTGTTIEEIYGEAGLADAKTNLIGYTFALTEGLNATVSLEDPTTSDRRAYDGAFYGGLRYPDLVANLNLTQEWGSAQVMGALHEDRSGTSGSSSKLGWAIGAGVQLNLPMLGAEDLLGLQVAYARGASGYGGLDDFMFDFYEIPEFQAKVFSVTAGYNHTFNDAWSAAAQVSYARLTSGYTDVADSYSLNIASIDYSASVTWAPVTGLSFDLGAEYRHREISGSLASEIGETLNDWVLVGRVTRTF